jgi:hypothetical protein
MVRSLEIAATGQWQQSAGQQAVTCGDGCCKCNVHLNEKNT